MNTNKSPCAPEEGTPITVSNLQFVENFVAERPDLVGLFSGEPFLRALGFKHFDDSAQVDEWLTAARDLLESKGMCSVSLMTIGHNRFGNPIPRAWYEAAEDLVREVGAIAQAIERESADTLRPRQ